VKRLLIIVVVIVAVIFGGSLLKKDTKKSTAVAKPTNHTIGIGSGTTGVVVKEYGDFQCPGCGAFFPTLKEIKDKYKDKITFQFVHFPLSQIHQNALSAHRAAEAASNQGKFWEMHDLLYTNQNAWSRSTTIAKDLEVYAQELGLDIEKYRTDYASSLTNSIIQADIKTGQELKVTGTPTFFIDGKKIEDNNSISTVATFSSAIDAAIAAKAGQTATPSQ
jgi:protein-disulfide isomerase